MSTSPGPGLDTGSVTSLLPDLLVRTANWLSGMPVCDIERVADQKKCKLSCMVRVNALFYTGVATQISRNIVEHSPSSGGGLRHKEVRQDDTETSTLDRKTSSNSVHSDISQPSKVLRIPAYEGIILSVGNGANKCYPSFSTHPFPGFVLLYL